MAHLWRRIPRTGDKRKMTEVEQLAQEQFNTFRNRFCEMISEIAEEYRSAFIQGYAKGETDEKFRTKQVIKYDYNNEVAKEYTTLQERIAELETQIEKMKCCENCKHSDTECEGHIVCNKGHFFDCLSNKIFDHTSDEKDYWEIEENEL